MKEPRGGSHQEFLRENCVPLVHGEITGAVLAAAVQVHKELGPGFVEAIYETALVWELTQRGVPHERQYEIEVRYRGAVVGTHRLDLLVSSLIVVELKAVSQLRSEHFAIVRSYLRATGLEHGLLLNFAAPTLEARRVISRLAPSPPSSSPS